jgi:hypothetical protein
VSRGYRGRWISNTCANFSLRSSTTSHENRTATAVTPNTLAVGEYDGTTRTGTNSSLITGLDDLDGFALSGNNPLPEISNMFGWLLENGADRIWMANGRRVRSLDGHVAASFRRTKNRTQIVMALGGQSKLQLSIPKFV